jgi:hypothetical protein
MQSRCAPAAKRQLAGKRERAATSAAIGSQVMGGRSGGAACVGAGATWAGISTNPCVGSDFRPEWGTPAMPLNGDAQ